MIYLSTKFPYEHNTKKWDYLSRVVWDFGRLPGAWQFKKLSTVEPRLSRPLGTGPNSPDNRESG